MRIPAQAHIGGSVRFFSLSFSDGALANYYKMNFNLLYYHKIEPAVFEEMIPWERDIYINMLIKVVEEENEKAKMNKSAARARAARSS